MNVQCKRPMTAPERELQVLNQKAEHDRTQKLHLIDKQFRYSYKMLQQRKDYLRKERKKMGTVIVCEPKAIVDVAMKEIDEFSSIRGVHTAHGTRHKIKVKDEEEKQSRSISAPPVKHKGNIQSSVSLLQMKNIALIDSISEKEKARRQQREREEMERMRRLQMEALQRKVQEFIERLKEKSRMD